MSFLWIHIQEVNFLWRHSRCEFPVTYIGADILVPFQRHSSVCTHRNLVWAPTVLTTCSRLFRSSQKWAVSSEELICLNSFTSPANSSKHDFGISSDRSFTNIKKKQWRKEPSFRSTGFYTRLLRTLTTYDHSGLNVTCSRDKTEAVQELSQFMT